MPLKPCLLLALLFCFTRAAASTFTVTTNADSGPGSLRQALLDAAANGTASADNIVFNIPYTNKASITIQLVTALAEVTGNLTIDGTTEPAPKLGVSDAKVIIEPIGGNNQTAMLDSCLVLRNADNVQIYGLCIEYFYDFDYGGDLHYGISVWLFNANNLVFGAPGKGNVVAGCSYGVFKAYSQGTVNKSTFQGNIFGLDVDGVTKLVPTRVFSNAVCILLTLGDSAEIGGTLPQQGNVLSCNAAGASFSAMTGHIDIGNNKFNTDYTGNAEVTGGEYGWAGASMGSANYFIHNNTISGEADFTQESGRFLVTNNFLGTNPAQTVAFTYGGGILGFNNCTGGALIGGNDASTMNVLGNGPFGVVNNNSTRITILHNSIYCHEAAGIYLYNYYGIFKTPFVTINSLSATSVSGTARPHSIVELYETDGCRNCEGKIFVARLNADANGNWVFNGPVPTDLTATATNFDDSTTSAFAQPQLDASAVTVTNATCNKANGSIGGIVVGSGTNFTWTDAGGNVVGTGLNLANVPAGTYQLAVGIGTGGCKAISPSFTITTTAPPNIDAGSFTQTAASCGAFNGNILYTQPFAPETAYWFDPFGDTVGQGAALNTGGEGAYIFRLVAAGDSSCHTDYGPLNIVNVSGPTVGLDDRQVTPSTCRHANGSITNIQFSNVTGTAVYRWYDAAGNLMGSGPDLTNVMAGKYQLKFKDQSGCDTIATYFMTIGNTGSVGFDTAGRVIGASHCSVDNGSVSGILVTNGATYSWIDTVTRAIVGNNADLSNVGSGFYELIVTSVRGCVDSSGPFFVPLASPAPLIQSGSAKVSPDLCMQQTGSISGITIQGSGPFSYAWYNGSGQLMDSTATLTNLIAGTYWLQVTDANNCADTSGAFVVTNAVETVNAPGYPNVVLLKGSPATLKVLNPEAGIYALYPNQSAPLPDQSDSSGDFVTGPIAADTTVYVVLQKGDCASAATAVAIKTVLTLEQSMPNAFTPNQDGHNDVFRLPHPELVTEVDLTVFNRWGQRVFKSSDPSAGWDGNMNGARQPGDAYAYTLTYTDIAGNKHALTGTVLLIR